MERRERSKRGERYGASGEEGGAERRDGGREGELIQCGS